ncbi:MAG: LamG domain-containing protein, partial [Myxococcota bacterium]
PMSICNEGSSDRPFLGEIRMVAVYSRGLTPTEIAQNYQAGPDGYASSCQPTGVSEALCNGYDDDCDGLVDEDYAPIPTQCGQGQCGGETGQRVCVNGTQIDVCNPFAAASVEICDGIDNDCDGHVDEQGACSCASDADCVDATACTVSVCGAAGTCEVERAVACESGSQCDPSTAICAAGPARTRLGLVAFYPFTEGAGTTVHDRAEVGYTPNDLTISSTNTAAFASTTNGLDCFGGIVTTPGSASGLNQKLNIAGRMTFEAWLEPTDAVSSESTTIVQIGKRSSDFDMLVQQLSHGRIHARLRTNNAAGHSYVPYPQHGESSPWQRNPVQSMSHGLNHVVVTYDGAQIRVYINGEEHGRGGLRGWLTEWDDALTMCGNADGSRPWSGRLKLVAFYNRALTPDEISVNFTAGPHAIAHW